MLNRIQSNLRRIRCYHSANEVANVVEKAKSNDYSYLEFLDELISVELSNRNRNRIKRNEKQAHFSTIKTFDEFDFRFQTSISKREIKEWLTFSWIDQRRNKILMGPPGVGKTHLALATGFSAIHKGYKVVFYTMQGLMEEMIICEAEKKFEEYLKKLLKYDLIIIDELGYLPLKPVYGNMFFQLINQCYEYRSIMITSNKLFNEWGVFFGNQTIATAILDRILHHSESIILNGDSYRLKDIKGNL